MKLTGLTDTALQEVLRQPLVAKLATHDPDGDIRMTPVWFRADADGSLVIATWRKTAAARNVAANPRCSMLIDFEVAEPYYGVHFYGTATVEGPENDAEAIADVYAPYKTSREQAVTDAKSLIDEGTMVFIRFRPERQISWDFRE